MRETTYRTMNWNVTKTRQNTKEWKLEINGLSATEPGASLEDILKNHFGFKR